MTAWTLIAQQLPPDGQVVQTKIEDGVGIRSVQKLIRKGRTWFIPDGSIQVFYTPTHWKI